jgi:hypothetical protein
LTLRVNIAVNRNVPTQKPNEPNAAQALKISDLESKLKYYESINVRQLVNELTEKTRILEVGWGARHENRALGHRAGARA